MQLNFPGLLDVIAKHLYSEKKVFLRELIQNAHDGVVRRSPEGGLGRIDIETRPQDLRVVVRDTGVGMDQEDLVAYLSTIGAGMTRLAKKEVEGLVGQFGIGFLSAFVVARRVEVRTRKQGDVQGWIWVSDGGEDYELASGDVAEVGTSVIVDLRNPEDRGLIQEAEVRELILRYADMLAVPIYLNGSVQPENTMRMPWERAGLDLAGLQFECEVYINRVTNDRVLEAIPVRLEGPVLAEGVLYITARRSFAIDMPRNIRVFQNRMFLCDEGRDILPNWARFVNGIINTPDLTPTAARDNFIRDDNAAALANALGKLVIDHLDRLRQTNPERFAKILDYHRIGVAAACYYFDEFFARFGHLLLWRTNRAGATSSPRKGVTETERTRTLPEILADLPDSGRGPKRLLCFTSPNRAENYFEIADAASATVIDASGLFEAELLEAYARRHEAEVSLVHVDRDDDVDLFPRAGDDDGVVQQLAQRMSQTIRTPSGGEVRTDARRFLPADIAAIVRADAKTRALRKAEEIRLDPNAPEDLQEMAAELEAMSAHATLKLTINAGNPLVRRLAAQPLNEPGITELIHGLYNSAIFASKELVTAHDARTVQSQFLQLIEIGLDHLEVKRQLREATEQLREQTELRRAAAAPALKHRVFFMITPFADRYQPVVKACRAIVEDRWGCELVVANDRYDDNRLLENVRALMSQADAFIAEVTDANPNVMFELGVAYAELPRRPVILLRDRDKESDKPQLPADLRGLLYVDYSLSGIGDMVEAIAAEMRKHNTVRTVVDDQSKANYLSPTALAKILPFQLPAEVLDRLSRLYPTREDWHAADVNEVAEILGRDADLAAPIINRVVRER